MSEMIERVAANLLQAGNNHCFPLDAGTAVLFARAAIEAMREPTDEMCEAAGWGQQSDVNSYQRAIDAALTSQDTVAPLESVPS